MGITVGIWVRKETVVDGVLNAFTVNREETEEKAILTFIVNGDVVLNCDNFNAYADYPDYEIILSVPEGASLTVPEGITLDLDSYTGVEMDGELIVNGTLICTHEGGEATCKAPAACDKCKQGYGEKLPHDFSMYEHGVSSCEDYGYRVIYCAVCGVYDESTRESIPPTGHEWIDATYESPKTCFLCGKTEGEPLEQESESETETETIGSEIENGGNQGGNRPQGGTNKPQGGTNKPQGGTQDQKPEDDETESKNAPVETEKEQGKGTEDSPSRSETEKKEALTTEGGDKYNENEKKSGCKSSIGIGVVAMVTILGAAVVFRKKED